MKRQLPVYRFICRTLQCFASCSFYRLVHRRGGIVPRGLTPLAAALALIPATAGAETFGAATLNEHQVAYALGTIGQEDITGTELGQALSALRTAGAGDASRELLYSLGGAGLSGVQKVLSADSTQHLQTLRSTLRSLQEGHPVYSTPGKDAIPWLGNGSVSAALTGGTDRVNGRPDTGDYTRDNVGFILTELSPLDENWTFGCSFAYSSSDAHCHGVSIDTDAYYSDFAILYNRGRLHQLVTLGAGFYRFDTTRTVGIPGSSSHHTSALGSTSATAVTFSYEVSYELIRSSDARHSLSPVAMAEATFAQFKDMYESGAGNAGLHSTWDNVQCLTVGTGFRYTYRFELQKQPGFFSLDVLTLATSGDDTMTVTSQFLGGGGSFEQWGPKAGGSALRLNAATIVPLSESWALLGNVSAEFRSHQSCVSGSAGAVFSF